jgi:NAD(P)H-dependent nitrite reductase small subunit
MPYINTTLKLAEVPVGGSRCFEIGELQIGLFHQPEGLFAIDNVCPHHGAPLHDGFVTDGQVACPWHQWHFQLKDGLCANIPGARVAVFSTEIRDGDIWIDIAEDILKKS